MYYYVVPMIGVGTADDPLHPDLPAEISYVGCDCRDGKYTIATANPVAGLTALTNAQLIARCKTMGPKLADVLTWRLAQ